MKKKANAGGSEALLTGVKVVAAPRKDTKFRQFKYNFHGRELTLQGYEHHALEYLTRELKIKPADIICECENDFEKTLNIRYKHDGKWRHYLPDAYIRSKRTVIEVKSVHTLGLESQKKRGWTMTCAKARATKEKGYGIILLLMQDDGSRIPMPQGWYTMKKADVIKALEPYLKSKSILEM